MSSVVLCTILKNTSNSGVNLYMSYCVFLVIFTVVCVFVWFILTVVSHAYSKDYKTTKEFTAVYTRLHWYTYCYRIYKCLNISIVFIILVDRVNFTNSRVSSRYYFM